MVAHLVRLKLTLLRNMFKRSRAQAIGAIIGVLYGSFFVSILAVGVAALRVSPADARAFIPLGGATAIILWSVVPVLAFGSDPTLDPSRFATFAVPYRQLATGLVLGGVVGLPGLATSVVAAATIITWSHGAVATAVAVVCAIVGVLTCVTMSRWLSALVTGALTSRRGRDITAVVLLVLIVGLALLASVLGNIVIHAEDGLRTIGGVIGATPLGWVWAAPGDFAAGHVVIGTVRLVLALAFLLGLGVLWLRALTAQVESPRAVTRTDAVSAPDDLGAFARTSDSQAGAVAAQVISYYRRDPRYQANLFLIPLVPLILLVPFSASNVAWAPLLMAPLGAYLLGFGEHNAVAYESTAFWLHVSAGTPGRADRLGRLVVNALISSVVVPSYAVGGAWLAGRWELLPAILGVSLAFLGVGYGLSCVQSVTLPYPVPKPGDSPFSSPPGAAGITLAAQMLASTGTVILSSPVLLLAWLAWSEHSWARWATAGAGVILGAGIFLVGLQIGARLYERRGPELLQSLERA
ncbi:MAG: hypothetical protein ABIZ07_00895 [Dermatophilaceae bacterium]